MLAAQWVCSEDHNLMIISPGSIPIFLIALECLMIVQLKKLIKTLIKINIIKKNASQGIKDVPIKLFSPIKFI